MSSDSSQRRLDLLQYSAKVASLFTFALGALVLFGWAIGNVTLKSVLPGLVTMKANTAVCFVLAGVSLWLLAVAANAPDLSSSRRRIAQICAVVVFIIGLLTLLEYLFGKKLGIDELLFRDNSGIVNPGRMAPSAALSFMISATALLRMAARRVRHFALVEESLALVVMAIGLFALIGYVVDIGAGYRWWNYTAMAVHTSIGFIAFGAGLSAAAWRREKLHWSLDPRTTIAFLGGLLLLLILAGVSYKSTVRLLETANWVSHEHETIKNINDVTLVFDDAETGQRSYLLTGEKQFIEMYLNAKSRFKEELQQVRDLTRNSPDQQPRLARLEPLIAERLGWADETIKARQEKGFETAAQMIASGKGQATSKEIRDIIAEMEAREEQLLVRRNEDSKAGANFAFLVMPVGGFLSLLVLSAVLFSLNREVTERKQTEAALAERENRLKTILDSEPECVKLLAADATLLEMNPAGLAMIEADSFEQVAGKPILGIIDPACRAAFQELIERVFRGESGSLEFEIVGLKGTRRWLDTHSTPLRNKEHEVTALLGVTRDITERKRMERERQAIFEIIQGVSTSANLDSLLQLIHQTIQQVLYAENCFVALYEENTAMLTMQFFVDQRDPAPAPHKVGRGRTGYVFRTGWPMLMTNEVFETLVEQGEIESIGTPPAAWLGVPLNSLSKTIGVFVVQHYEDDKAYSERDLEFLSSVGGQIAVAIERKRAEVALRESEERYREIFEMDLTGSCISSADGRVLACNPAFARIFGFSSVAEALASPARSFYKTSDAREELIELVRRERKIENRETELVRRDGSSIFVVQNLQGVFDEGGELLEMHSHFLDITERKQAESALRASQLQLQQSQKLEAVGQLAGGVAHDFNNLLTAINGYSSLALRRLDDASPLKSYIEEISKAGDRAANLTRQLLAFSRKQILEPKVLDLNEVVGDMSKMLRRMIGEDIDLLTVLASDLGRVKADPGQIEQIIMNLVVNARDAMPSGGKVTIETANAFLDDEYAREHLPTEPGHYVMLAISDTGMGMDAETQARIFEPFFTTKELGKGTGLGLSTVYGIVKQSDGFVWVYSEPGHGTTFKIYLPQVDAEKTTKAKPVDEAAHNGSETILVVEDDDVVRKLAREILETAGYDVLVADQGDEAMRLCIEDPQEIHLLLSDVVMPGASGKEVAERLISLRPEMKVLFMSGYTDEAIVHHGVLDSKVEFIQKPFSPAALCRRVREVLDSN